MINQDSDKVWSLSTPLDGAEGVSVQISAQQGESPRLLYWGPMPPLRHINRLGRHRNYVSTLDVPAGVPMLPVTGHGFFGAPALCGHHSGAGWAPVLTTDRVEEVDGRLEITLLDDRGWLELRLVLSLCPHSGVLSQHVELTNTHERSYWLDWAASAAWPVPRRARELLNFHGAWCQEFETERIKIPQGKLLRESRKGRPSHDGFPGLIVGHSGFTETEGQVFGATLGFSGNHRLLVERTHDGAGQIQLGELLMPGELRLAPGETYTSPEVHGCLAPDLRTFSQRFHRFVRELLPAEVSARPRPVHYNSWEAIYFDHHPQVLIELAQRAAKLGAERFVLDDGWFVGRGDDTAALGDWRLDPVKYPDGLDPVIEQIEALGMEFGLWVEPEMVNENSELYRANPHWALSLPGVPPVLGRGQLVLNLALPEVQEYLLNSLDALLSEHRIGYLKWDHNRDLAQVADAEGHPLYHENVKSLYALLDRLRALHPSVEIESCASGGGRIDLGILKRTHRVWTSDSNDALARLRIQRGASYFFPALILGSHVGPERCHTSGRRFDLLFRAHVAFFGSFGFEMDVRQLTEAEIGELGAVTQAYTRWRPLLHAGQLVRLEPDTSRRMALGIVEPSGENGVFGVFQVDAPGHQDSQRVRLAGLDPDAQYKLTTVGPVEPSVEKLLPPALLEGGPTVPGRGLMHVGLWVPMPHPATSLIFSAERAPDTQDLKLMPEGSAEAQSAAESSGAQASSASERPSAVNRQPELHRPVSEAPLSSRAQNALRRHGVHTIADLLELEPQQIRTMRAVGDKTASELEELQSELRGQGPAAANSL